MCAPLPLDMQRDTGLPHQTDGSGTRTTRTATSLMHWVCSTVQAGNNDTSSNHSNIIETVPVTGTLFSHLYIPFVTKFAQIGHAGEAGQHAKGGIRQIFVQTLPNPKS